MLQLRKREFAGAIFFRSTGEINGTSIWKLDKEHFDFFWDPPQARICIELERKEIIELAL